MIAEEWLDAHRRLPVIKKDGHPGASLASHSPGELWAEASGLSEKRYWQRRRRLAVQLLAALAGCGERTARAAVRSERPTLPPPDLEWGPDKVSEYIVGRLPNRVQRELEGLAARSRLDPDDPKVRRLWDWEGEVIEAGGPPIDPAVLEKAYDALW